MRARVIVVDDDEVSRRGLGEILADHPAIEVGGVLSHHAALTWDGNWHDVDVVIVDAGDERRLDDHCPGVEVVEHVRRAAGTHFPVIIAITGQFFDDAVRSRMREADADFLYHRSEVQDSASLYAAVLHPDAARVGGSDMSVRR